MQLSNKAAKSKKVDFDVVVLVLQVNLKKKDKKIRQSIKTNHCLDFSSENATIIAKKVNKVHVEEETRQFMMFFLLTLRQFDEFFVSDKIS